MANRIVVTPFLNEYTSTDEKWVVRELDSEGNVLRTRMTQTHEDAEAVRREWEKR